MGARGRSFRGLSGAGGSPEQGGVRDGVCGRQAFPRGGVGGCAPEGRASLVGALSAAGRCGYVWVWVCVGVLAVFCTDLDNLNRLTDK